MNAVFLLRAARKKPFVNAKRMLYNREQAARKAAEKKQDFGANA